MSIVRKMIEDLQAQAEKHPEIMDYEVTVRAGLYYEAKGQRRSRVIHGRQSGLVITILIRRWR